MIYTLSDDHGNVLKLDNGNEPLGWENDLPKYKSSTFFTGVVNKYSTSLRFVKDGADFIRRVYKDYGLEENIYLKKDIVHPTEINMINEYFTTLIGESFKYDNGVVSVGVIEGKLISQIKSKWNEKIELERLTTLDGKILPPIKKYDLLLDGKEIFRESIWGLDSASPPVIIHDTTGAGNTRGSSVSFPLELTQKGHDEAVSSTDFVNGDNSPNRTGGGGSGGFMIFSNSSKNRTLKFNFHASFLFERIQTDDLDWYNFGAKIFVYKNGYDYNYKDNRDLFTSENAVKYDGRVIDVSFNDTIYLLKDESIAIAFTQVMDGNSWINQSNLELKYETTSLSLTISENSLKEPTKVKVILPYDSINRALQIITNRTDNVLESDYFGLKDLGYSNDGEGAFLAIASGFAIRNFEKPTQTTVKKLFENYKIIKNIDIGINNFEDYEKVTINKKDFYFKENIKYRFPFDGEKVKITVNEKEIYSSAILGYLQGGSKYEEVQGLLEPMGQIEYSLPINKKENIKTMLCSYNADPTRIELLRRKQKDDFPDTDTDFDDKIFFFDAKKGNNILVLRKWQDDYLTEPLGIFSPDTYFNYKLLPQNLFLEHQREFMIGIHKYLNKEVVYSGGVGSFDLILDGKKTTDNLPINQLKQPRHSEYFIDFEHKIDFNLKEEIKNSFDNQFEIKIDNEIITLYLRNADFNTGKFTKAIIVHGY